jgi:hypothetical protein
MINPRYVTAHGKRILIETLEMPGLQARQAKRTRRRQETFVMLPLEWVAETANAARTPGAVVWILLAYMAWKAKSQTFPLSNVLLVRYGVARETKRRVLIRLEAAGQIKIDRRRKQAPIITILRPIGAHALSMRPIGVHV